MADTNMICGYFWACEILQRELPLSLSDVQKRARFVIDIDAIFLIPINTDLRSGGNGQLGDFSGETKRNILKDIAEKSKSYISIKDSNIPTNIGLRLWAGCMETTKCIAHETKNGANSPKDRAKRLFFKLTFFPNLI